MDHDQAARIGWLVDLFEAGLTGGETKPERKAARDRDRQSPHPHGRGEGP
jgi:hypothetical protein